MGTSRSTAELVQKLHSFGSSLDDSKRALIVGAETTKAIFRTTAGGAVGLKPYGKKKSIGVKDNFISKDTVVVTYTGPAHLINNPTQAHSIFRSVTTVRGRGARRANRERSLAVTFGGRGALVGGSLKFADGNYRKSVVHPGTKGKKFFEAAKLISFTRVPTVMAREAVTRPLKDLFG